MSENTNARLCLFGRPRIEFGSEVIDSFPTRRCAYILARLALAHQRQLSRAQLAEVLWPDEYYDATRIRLRQELTRLRRALGSLESIIEPIGESIRLDVSRLEIDVDDFERSARLAKETDDPQRRLVMLARIVEIGRMPFMAESSDDWVRIERIRLNVVRYGALVDLGVAHLEVGDADQALTAARNAIDIVSDREDAYLLAARALGALGHRADALSQLDILREIAAETRGGRISPRAMRVEAELSSTGSQENVGSTPSVRFPISAPTEPLLGRAEQLALLVEHLHPTTGEARILTVLGIGGIGKTHLIRHSCVRMAPAFERRVAFIDLSNIADAAIVPTAILRELGLGYAPTTDPIARLIQVLGTGATLLALDNLEQFGATIAPLISRLLSQAPGLRILAGSRIPLNVAGENRLSLAPLSLPDEAAGEDMATRSAAIQMFLGAMEADRMGRVLDAAEWPILSNIVRRLEGMPLGLQLAASRMRAIGPVQLLRDLDSGLDRLVSRRGDTPERHRSIRNAVTGSFEQLHDAAREALVALSVFRGGWTLDAAREVCQIVDPAETMDWLLDASLIYVAEDGPQLRFRMLETIRDYAAELLTVERRAELDQRLLQWIVHRSSSISAELVDRRVMDEFDLFEPELDNLRAAQQIALESNSAAAFLLGANLCSFWQFRTSGYEALQFYTDLFDRHGEGATGEDVLRASYAQAINLHFMLTVDRPEVYERTLRLGRELGDLRYEVKTRVLLAFYSQNKIRYADCVAEIEGIDQFVAANGSFESDGFVSRVKGIFLQYQGEPEPAVQHFREAAAWFRERGEVFHSTRTRRDLALGALDLGDLDLAELALEGLLEQGYETKFMAILPSIYSASGLLDLKRGRFAEALRTFNLSMVGWRELGNHFQEGDQWNNIGRTQLAAGNFEDARVAFGHAADMWVDEHPVAATYALFGLAAIRSRRGDPDRAARIIDVAKRECARAGAKKVRFHALFQQETELAVLAQLGLSAIAESGLSLDEAIRLGKSAA